MKAGMPYAVAIALLALMGGLLGLRGQEITPAKRPFGTFPMSVGDWRGHDVPIDQESLKVLKADDVLMRSYRAGDGPALSLFAAYYKSQRAGAAYHSPLNCLPGSGWSIASRDEVALSVGGRPMRINRVVIAKHLEQQVVLYWYQDRGRVIANEYAAKAYLMWDAMTRNRSDGALVRVVVPVTTSAEDALAVGRMFLDRTVPLLNGYLPG